MHDRPEYIMEMLRQRIGLESNDTSEDNYLKNLSDEKVFDEVTTGNGLIHYGDTFVSFGNSKELSI